MPAHHEDAAEAEVSGVSDASSGHDREGRDEETGDEEEGEDTSSRIMLLAKNKRAPRRGKRGWRGKLRSLRLSLWSLMVAVRGEVGMVSKLSVPRCIVDAVCYSASLFGFAQVCGCVEAQLPLPCLLLCRLEPKRWLKRGIKGDFTANSMSPHPQAALVLLYSRHTHACVMPQPGTIGAGQPAGRQRAERNHAGDHLFQPHRRVHVSAVLPPHRVSCLRTVQTAE